MGAVGPGFAIGGSACAKATEEARRIDARRKRLTFFIVTLYLTIVKYKEGNQEASDWLSYVQGT
jgi:hypothetical protein